MSFAAPAMRKHGSNPKSTASKSARTMKIVRASRSAASATDQVCAAERLMSRGPHPYRRRARIVRRAKTNQHAIATAESTAGAQWPSNTEAATAQPKARRLAATSYTGATKFVFTTWATAITTPQANVTDSRRLTTDVSLPCRSEGLTGGRCDAPAGQSTHRFV